MSKSKIKADKNWESQEIREFKAFSMGREERAKIMERLSRACVCFKLPRSYCSPLISAAFSGGWPLHIATMAHWFAKETKPQPLLGEKNP